MYNLYIPLCGLILNIVLFILYNWKVSKLREENIFYLCMIIDSLFMTVFCMLAIYTIYVDASQLTFIKITNKVECFSIFNFFANLLMYILYISNIKGRKINLFYFILNVTMFFLIFLAPVDLKVTNDLTYMVSVGASVNITTVSAGILLVLTFALAIKERKVLKEKIIPIILLLIFIVLVVIIRAIKPEFICLEFLATIAILIMFHTIENPDIKMIRELELAKLQAEKSNQAKSDFLSSMSHEIRTPLNAIVGLSEVVNNSDDLNEIHEDSKDIVSASHTLLDIVNGILDISKIEANKMEIIETNYNPVIEFEEISKLIESRIGEKELEFRTNFASDIPKNLYGDKGKVKQIITNLLSNAVKYTTQGYIDFNVQCINAKNKCKLIIIVEDTGRGIKKDQINKLFTKFNRLEDDMNTTIEGTGLGLAITKSLVELMGGKIVVDSTYGEGSKFTAFLEQKIASEEEIIEEEKKSSNIQKYDNSKVLVVDDNKLNIKVASKIFKELNIKVDEASSGFECIDKIENGEYYDIIFMDIMMPKMGGVETLKKLKNIKNFSIPVVALTADAMEGKSNKYIEVGFDDYITKPINRDKLNQILNKLLRNDNQKIKDENIIDDKVIPVTDEDIQRLEEIEEKQSSETKKGNIEFLKENDIDVDASIELLGDIEMFNKTL